MQHFSIFGRDSGVTLGTFALHFGRRDASESNVRHATRVVAAAAGAEERVFSSFFLEIQKGR